jgi:predicted nucleic acid-binding protein
MSWHFEEEFDAFAADVLQRLKKHDALVPRLFYIEVANVALMGERHRGLSQEKTADFLRLLRSLPILQDTADVATGVDDVLLLARIHGLTTYDATYLELARRSRLPLATRDQPLQRAAKLIGVPLVHVEAC